MTYRPFRSLGRFMLAACAVSFGALSLGAQTPAPTPAAPAAGPNPSKADVFLGYSYFGAHGRLKPAGIPYSSIDEGAIGSVAYYFNRYFGGEFIYSNHPDGVNDGFSGASLGPIVRLPMENFTLFAHGLAGGGRLGGPNSENPATREHEPYRWGPALTAGGGMDYDLPFFDNRFSLRLFQADYRYIHADFGPYTSIPTGGILGGRANLAAVELSTGIVMHFGHVIPPPPVAYSCSVAPASGYPGDPITVTGTATNLNPKKTATYSWTSTGGTISGTSSTANIDTNTAAPGTYTVTGHVTEGNKPGQSADCTAQFTINAFQPPTVSCSANPSSVNPGDSATITTTATSPQNRPLTYSYTATSGNISGTSSTATLSTSGAAPGPITVTCNVADDKGNTQSSTTTVTVVQPPPPPQAAAPAPTTSNLCTVAFGRDKARPARVDNEAKACLDEVALAMQRSSDAKLALVGNGNAKESKMRGGRRGSLAAQRAANTKDYLVTEKGIDASRINIYTGTGDDQSVAITLIPTGATMDMSNTTPVSDTVRATPRTAPARSRRKK
jgi:outer membrane protein OmpA-like peptidoglycan-associated protein